MAFLEGNGEIKIIYIQCLVKNDSEANICYAKVF